MLSITGQVIIYVVRDRVLAVTESVLYILLEDAYMTHKFPLCSLCQKLMHKRVCSVFKR